MQLTSAEEQSCIRNDTEPNTRHLGKPRSQNGRPVVSVG